VAGTAAGRERMNSIMDSGIFFNSTRYAAPSRLTLTATPHHTPHPPPPPPPALAPGCGQFFCC